MMLRNHHKQSGSVLIISLVLLVMLTLFVLTVINTTNINSRIAGNMQMDAEAQAAAQQAIETTISTTQFASTPADAILNPCGAANTLCTDINGDGVTDYTAMLTPQPACVKVRPIKLTELVLTNANDLACAAGQSQRFGVAGAVTGDSLCADAVWQITAETTSAANSAKVTVTQGVGLRISTDDMATSC